MSYVDYAHTEQAEDDRFRKATALVAALQTASYAPATARRLSEQQRRVVERFAGVPRCSRETWDAALSMHRSASHAGNRQAVNA